MRKSMLILVILILGAFGATSVVLADEIKVEIVSFQQLPQKFQENIRLKGNGNFTEFWFDYSEVAFVACRRWGRLVYVVAHFSVNTSLIDVEIVLFRHAVTMAYPDDKNN